MSKTDKTRPYWVKLADTTYKARKEYHDHADGICDIAQATGKDVMWYRGNGSCGYGVPYYAWHDGFYPTGGRWAKAEKRVREGGARSRLARDRHELLKLSGAELEDYDVINPRHRHGVMWEW